MSQVIDFTPTASAKAPRPGTNLEGCLVGTLEAWPLADIVTWLNQCQRTAMLRVGVGLDAGVVFFREGQLYRCEWGGLAGEEALCALLQVSSGAFVIIQRSLPEPHANITRSTPELLLHCSVVLDEDRRAAHS